MLKSKKNIINGQALGEPSPLEPINIYSQKLRELFENKSSLFLKNEYNTLIKFEFERNDWYEQEKK